MIQIKIDRNGKLILPKEDQEQTNHVVSKTDKAQTDHHTLIGKKIYRIQ